MNRRKFMFRVGGALIAVPAVLHMTACGDDGGGSNADATESTSFSASSTGSGHVHSLTVQCSALESSSDVMLTSGTGNSHTHPVTITAAQLSTIAGGGSVTINTTDQHPHAWTISAPSSACS